MDEQELKEQLKQEIKQEMKKSRKKKIVIILIILLIIASIVVFVVFNNRKRAEETAKQNETKIISEEEFAQYTTEIPITTENWQDYMELEDVTKENKNAFGEVENIMKNTQIKLKDNLYGYVVLEFNITNKDLLSTTSNDSTYIIEIYPDGEFNSMRLKYRNEGNNVYDSTLTINDLECIKAKGSVYTLDLPEELWQIENTMPPNIGKKCFYLGTKDRYSIYYEDNYIEQLSQREYEKDIDHNS